MRWSAALLALGLAWGAAHAQPSSDAGVVRFAYPDTTPPAVFLTGDFNGWSPTATPLDREGAAWVTRVFLDPGTYEYAFVVNGQRVADAANPERSAQGNSVVRIGDQGEVLPPRAGPGPTGGDSGAARPAVERSFEVAVRYLGFVEARRSDALGRWDLTRPTHDIDLRLDARLAPDVNGWFLANLKDGAGEAERTFVRYDRGLLAWTPPSYEAWLFDNTGVASFDDPGVLVGRVGIYGDTFGYARRGASLERRVLGAPLEFVWADDAEAGDDRVPATALPDLHGGAGASFAGRNLQRYVRNGSDRGADAIAFRARGGTDAFGIGISLRGDRGAAAGRLAEIGVESRGDTLVGRGVEFETREDWRAWGTDLRATWRGLAVAAEFLAGSSRARTLRAAQVLDLRATSTDTATARRLGEPRDADVRFDLDDSWRAILRLRRAARKSPAGAPAVDAAPTPLWTQHPAWAARVAPEIGFEYEEHDYSALVTGQPFLMRRSTVHAALGGTVRGVAVEADLEQHWFDYPAGATWETQFWFRRDVFWLDEDTARFERQTLLGADRAAVATLRAAAVVWPRHAVRGEATATWAAPGFDRAPRHVAGVVRFAVPFGTAWELRTHSRIATYRTVAGPTLAVLAGESPGTARGRRTFGAHFVEAVYKLSPRADIALGFGVDPIAVYEVTNEYADVGWDLFLFEHGTSPAEAILHPGDLGARIAAAEAALERERRLGLEARVRF